MTRFQFAQPRPARRPSLTPMIDVVFLLLVFFMLASRFGTETTIPLNAPTPSSEVTWDGPPRLVEFGKNTLQLNGVSHTQATLLEQLRALMPDTDAPVLLRPRNDAPTQRLVDLLEVLKNAGFSQIVIVE